MEIRSFLNFLLVPVLAIMCVMLMSIEYGFEDLKLEEMKELSEDIGSIDYGKNIGNLGDDINNLQVKTSSIYKILENNKESLNIQIDKISEKIEESSSQRKLSDDIYEQKISSILGMPIKTHLSKRNEIKIYELKELGYRGYIAKVKLFDPDSFKVVLGKDTLGNTESPSGIAKRKGAIFAINGGGFGKKVINGVNMTLPIGTTVVDGKYVTSDIVKSEPLFFAGINKKGQVIGVVAKKLEDIKNLNPYQGVSFIPALIRNYEKLDIPSAWKSTKHPRTLIGKYANDDLILIVIDGRQGNWSSGVSLERVQEKLLELGVKEAYNLDGGGSSVMYYDGEILNKPSDGRERAVTNSIIILP